MSVENRTDSKNDAAQKTDMINLDSKYLKISYVMLVAGITSILVCKMILQYGPDLGAIIDDPLTKFLNSITGIFFIGGVFTLYMTVPFLVRTFWIDKAPRYPQGHHSKRPSHGQHDHKHNCKSTLLIGL